MPVAPVASMPFGADQPPGDASPRARGVVRVEGGMNSVNFEFLRPRWPALATAAGFAERYVHGDPESCLTKLRILLEQFVEHVYSFHRLPKPWQSQLYDLLGHDPFKEVVPPLVIQKMHVLRMAGNKGAHGGGPTATHAQVVLREAFDLSRWFAVTYGGVAQASLPTFVEIKAGVLDESKAELKREKKDALERAAAAEARLTELLEENERLRKAEHEARPAGPQLDAVLAHTVHDSAAVVDAMGFDEAATRSRIIDLMLRDAGWDVSDPERVRLEEPVAHQPTTTGQGFADYVLLGDDGVPLAVVEAKKASVSLERGREQAKRYADGFERTHGRRPVIYYTNGYDLGVWNDAFDEPPRKVYGYHSRESLVYMTRPAAARMPARQIIPADRIVNRPYQREAIQRVIERFAAKHRRSLIIQATGTGKTRVAIALCEALIRAGWVRRVLFLCDRRELLRQANNAFGEFLPSEPRTIVTARSSTDQKDRIHLATYPAMMQCFAAYDVGFFDLIIADESHRSIYNRYRDIFLYFDALQVGLTATPVKFIARNTFSLFGCENENPTSLFTFDEAIAHRPPYLVPFKVTKVTTGFLSQGIKYSQMTKEQREQLEQQEQEPDAIEHEQREVDKRIYNRDTARVIIRNLMDRGIRDATGSQVGKSIVFARSHDHAVLLERVFNELYPQYGGRACRVIDNHEPRAEALIDEFKTPGSPLRIAISVDMLDTGIDVPEVVNLVFAKPVFSYVKFWQMIGRGTRLCADLFGPGRHKTEFRIFDHWDNFGYFEERYEEEQPKREVSLLERLFTARIGLAEACLRKPDLASFETIAGLVVADVAALPDSTIAVRDKWQEVVQCRNPERVKRFDPATVGTLRQEVAQLMQWRDIEGESAAYDFDLLVARAQTELAKGGGAIADHRDRILDCISELQYNLNPVREREQAIARVKSPDFWNQLSIAALEEIRLELRGVMKYRQPTTGVRSGPKVIDVAEDVSKIEAVEHRPKLEGTEFLAYRERVEGLLRSLFDQNPTLRRIKAGLPVSQADLEALVSLVLTQDPGLNLAELTHYYPGTAGRLDEAIRAIIGLDADKVHERFAAFIGRHALNSMQLRFLQVLEAHIAHHGPIEVDRLYDAPFTTIDAAGLDGVFTDDVLVDELLGLLDSFKHLGKDAPP